MFPLRIAQMLNTLDAFGSLNLPNVGVSRGSTPATLKKAFHRASLSLHPDRVQNSGLDTKRRAEAEELFKALSAAFDRERAQQDNLSC